MHVYCYKRFSKLKYIFVVIGKVNWSLFSQKKLLCIGTKNELFFPAKEADRPQILILVL